MKNPTIKPSLSSTLSLKKLTLPAVVILLLGNFVAHQATPLVQAQSRGNIDLTVSPPVAYLQVNPGTRLTHTITIKNTGESAMTITPSVKDFMPDPKTGSPILLDESSFKYFAVPEKELQPIEIQPSQTKQVNITISPPKDAPEKEYPLSIIFDAQASSTALDYSSLSADKSSLVGGVASNMIVLVSEKNQIGKQQAIADMGIPKIIDSFRTLELKPVVKNEGFATSTVVGQAVIKNWLGKEVASFQFFPDNILGLNQRPLRALNASKPDSPQPMPMKYKPSFLLGPYVIEYTINNQLEPSGNPDPESVSVVRSTVVAMPIFVMVAVIAGIIVAAWYWRQGKGEGEEGGKNPFE